MGFMFDASSNLISEKPQRALFSLMTIKVQKKLKFKEQLKLVTDNLCLKSAISQERHGMQPLQNRRGV